MILIFWILSFKQVFSFSSFTLINRLFSSSLLSAVRVVSSAYWMLLIFLLAVLIPACASSSLPFHMMCSAYKLKKQGDSLDVLLSQFGTICCFLSGSDYCFLTCIQVSQEAGQVVWYSHLFQNLPQFSVIHTVKGFSVVNKVEVDVFSGTLLLFLMIQRMLAICSLVPLPFLNPAWTSGSSQFTHYWSLPWRILSITLLACEMRAIAR